MLKIGLLACGELGLDVLTKLHYSCDIKFALTDANSIAISELCEKQKIPYLKGNPRKGNWKKIAADIAIDVLISINYIYLIEIDLIQHPGILAFNIHGSLLPKYRGRTPHVWAIIHGENETGITAHKIDEGCDTGDIIEQVVVPIGADQTGGDILKVFKELYYPLVVNVLKKIEDGTLNFKKQNHKDATFYGKRTPSDGLIDWTWSASKIFNWIRAQALPYPGAFSFYKGQKVIIDSSHPLSEPSKLTPPGTIIKFSDGFKVASGDNFLQIIKFRELNFSIQEGEKFNNEN